MSWVQALHCVDSIQLDYIPINGYWKLKRKMDVWRTKLWCRVRISGKFILGWQTFSIPARLFFFPERMQSYFILAQGPITFQLTVPESPKFFEKLPRLCSFHHVDSCPSCAMHALFIFDPPSEIYLLHCITWVCLTDTILCLTNTLPYLTHSMTWHKGAPMLLPCDIGHFHILMHYMHTSLVEILYLCYYWCCYFSFFFCTSTFSAMVFKQELLMGWVAS